MWNEEIKQKIISELNEELDATIKTSNIITTYENHSYIDSIFPQNSTMFKPITPNLDVPNYYESVITGMRTIKEVPIHTMAFSDSFDKNYKQNFSFVYGKKNNNLKNEETIANDTKKEIYDMTDILNSSSAVTILLTPEERNVALKPKKNMQDILFADVDLRRNVDVLGAIKKFCNIQIKI